VYDPDEDRIVHKEVKYVPGLYKIFGNLSLKLTSFTIDEILVNAADNYQRDKTMSMIKVEIDPENNKISVWNNGKGIPVQIHKEHNMYVPDMIFGKSLSYSGLIVLYRSSANFK
jgi:DNA topoisomerase-2